VEDLVVVHIRHAMRVIRVWNNVVKEWGVPITVEENSVIRDLRDGKVSVQEVQGFERIVMAWEGKWGQVLSKMGRKVVPTCAEDIVLDEMEKEQGVLAIDIWTNRINWTSLEIRKWKARVKQVEGYLAKPVVLARKVLYWRGKLKK